MRKFDVDIHTVASATVRIEIGDDRLSEIADELGVPVNELTINDLMDEIAENYVTPSICAQCSGWGKNYGLELSDEWDFSAIRGEPLSSAVREIDK